jgi:hypothetical protein
VSDTALISPTPHRVGKLERPKIRLPDGRILQTRASFANELGVAEKTVSRQNHETWVIGGIAYIQPNSALKQIASRARRRRNEPPRRRQPKK